MDLYSGYINKLIEALVSLPGIGNKSAQRLAFHMIHMPDHRQLSRDEGIKLNPSNIKGFATSPFNIVAV